MPLLYLLETDVSIQKLHDDPELFQAEIVTRMGFSSEEEYVAIYDIVKAIRERGVWWLLGFDHKPVTEGDLSSPIHVMPPTDFSPYGEISLSISDELKRTLPPGLLARFD